MRKEAGGGGLRNLTAIEANTLSNVTASGPMVSRVMHKDSVRVAQRLQRARSSKGRLGALKSPNDTWLNEVGVKIHPM